MRQAIQTKYFGPSNIHGARVRAYAAAGYKTIEWDHALNAEQNHERAASELAHKYGWDKFSRLIGGVISDGSYVWVQLEKETET